MSTLAPISGLSIARRAGTAIFATGGRHALALVSGVIIARSLGPVQFGNFMFLLAGFASIHTLLDLGTSQAFFTFICRQSRSAVFFLYYGAWVGLQFVTPFVIIFLVLPEAWIEEIWRGQDRELVVMAFMASFAQRVLWQMTTQICESRRLTMRIQLSTVVVMGLHLGIVVAMNFAALLTPSLLFIAIAAEFTIGSAVVLLSLPPYANDGAKESESFGVLVRGVGRFVVPLIPPLVLQTANSIGDTWLLQIFGGAEQQAYFNIALQYANIGYLFGFSATNVLWMEIAAAHARNDISGMRVIYRNGTRALFMVAATVAGFGIYWTTPAIALLLGPAYTAAGTVFGLTLITAIFQCFGIVVSVTYLGTGRTRIFALFGTVYGLASLPASLLVLWALHLGAVGLGAKLLVVTAANMLISDWYICRLYGWRTDNLFRFGIGAALFALGAVVHEAVSWALPGAPAYTVLLLAAAIFGSAVVGSAVFVVPKMFHRA